MSSEATTGPTSSTRLKRMLGESGTFIALFVLVIVLSVTADGFLSTNNLLNIGVQASVFAILAFGQLFTIISGGIDLSVGSIAALSGMVTAWSATSVGINPFLSVLMGLLVGLIAGFVNGALVAYGKLPAFIATLAMLSIARGLTLVISQGVPISTPDLVTWLGSDIGGWLPVPLLVMIFMGIIASIILNFTFIGRTIYAIGGNEEAARLSGIRVDRMQFVIYGLAALFSAVAGLLLAGRLASAQPTAAFGYELQAIAAVVIGGASLTGGVGRASGALIGALILAVITNGLNLLQVSSFWQQVVIGVVIALAVLVDTVRRKAIR